MTESIRQKVANRWHQTLGWWGDLSERALATGDPQGEVSVYFPYDPNLRLGLIDKKQKTP